MPYTALLNYTIHHKHLITVQADTAAQLHYAIQSYLRAALVHLPDPTFSPDGSLQFSTADLSVLEMLTPGQPQHQPPDSTALSEDRPNAT